jgi:hypothetical protein
MEMAVEALTMASLFLFRSAFLASLAALRMLRGTVVSSAMRDIISATCFSFSSEDTDTTPPHAQSPNFNPETQ